MAHSSLEHPILLYDGLCGFCNGTVQFVVRHDARGVIRFATLQGEFARGVVARHPELAGVDSLILVETSADGQERVYARSSGALRVARHLGGAWHLTRALAIVPLFIRDWAYDLFARHRYRVFGRFNACPMPSAEHRQRFIE